MPGDVEHGGTAGPQGATVLDVFVPVREDYRARASGGQIASVDRHDGAGDKTRVI